MTPPREADNQHLIEEFCNVDIHANIEIRWQNGDAICRALTHLLDACLGESGRLSAELFQYLLEDIDEEGPFAYRSYIDDEARFEKLDHTAQQQDPRETYSQWCAKFRALVEHPVFAADPRYLIFLRRIVPFVGFLPFQGESCLYTTNTDGPYAKDCCLREGFGPQHIPIFSHIIEEEMFWERTADCNGGWWYLFSSIGRALGVLSREHAQEALQPRIRLLEQTVRAKYLSEISRNFMVTSFLGAFTTPHERRALGELIQKDPYADVAHYAALLLEQQPFSS